jgi:hypothetical protein
MTYGQLLTQISEELGYDEDDLSVQLFRKWLRERCQFCTATPEDHAEHGKCLFGPMSYKPYPPEALVVYNAWYETISYAWGKFERTEIPT